MTDARHDDYLDRLADSHQDRLANALQRLENRIAELMTNAPTTDGALFDLEWAVQARTQLRTLIDSEFLTEIQSILEQYPDVGQRAFDMLGEYGRFTYVSRDVVTNLQRLSFQGFEAMANEYLDILATGIYQNTLTGENINNTILNLRQSINGVYIQSDEEEIQRLVEVAKNATGAKQQAAIDRLHTVYAADKVGNNMRKYARQMVQDSLMQFDASINVAIGKEAGATKWKYYGDVIRDSRPFCAEHAGNVYTDEEIAQIWSGDWKGKAAGSPFIVRGGYNCRHHFRPVLD